MPVKKPTFSQRIRALLTHPDAKREDGWKNFTTGIGTSRDKTTRGRFWANDILDHNELLALYNGSDLAARGVEKVPQEMMRRGYDLSADDVDVDDVKALRKQADGFRTDELFLEAMIWGGLFGGSLLLIGADDGQTPDMPLNEKNIRSIKYLNQVDRRFVWVQSYYSDPLSPKYGLPEKYLITNTVSQGNAAPALQGAGKTATVVIHETRTIRFDGAPTDVLTRQQQAGWTLSLLQRVYDQLRKFEHAFDSAGHLLSDASQAVFKLRGLIDAIAAGGVEKIQTRMRLLDESRSVARAVVIDAGDGNGGSAEEFKREPTQFGGVSDILQMEMMRVAACFDMPQTELFGRAPAGLNATGDADTRKWYDKITSKQMRDLGPKLKRWYTLLSLAKDSPITKKDAEFELKFHPLWSPTDLEQAQVDYTRAQMDQIYVNLESVTPEEVALDRQDLYPSMDVQARKDAQTAAKSFEPYQNDPEDKTLVGAGQVGESQGPAVPLPLPASPSDDRGT